MTRNNPYRLFLGTLRENWHIYSLGMMAMLITSFSEVMIPKFIQWSVDLVTAKKDVPPFLSGDSPRETLNTLVIILLGSLVLGWLGRILWRQILARQSHRAGHRIKTRIWDTIKDQPVNLLDRYSLGDLMNRSTGDWNRTRFIHGFTIVMTFDLIFFSVLSTISMLLIDWKTTLLCLLIIPFLPRPILKISKEESKLHSVAQESLSELSELISQSVSTVRLQRSTASEDIWLKRLGKLAEEYAQKQFQVLKASMKIFRLSSLPTIFSYGILYSFGLYQIQRGELTIGSFLALQSYVLLLQGPLFELGGNISEWQTGFASYKRIAEIYDLKREDRLLGARPTAELSAPAIELAGLSVSYDSDKNVLSSINLIVNPGERIGFMGPIGSGKTTLVHVVAGLHEDFAGEVKLFAESIREESRKSITNKITMVPQKPFLFSGSVRHNLTLTGDRSDEDLIEALKAVDLYGDVQSFPKGLDSWIGEWGLNLSGGQKQRLALARALLKPSPILILDDCLSAVDSVTEARILHNLRPYLKDRAVLWTAHRLSSLTLCHRIFEMNEGELRLLENEGTKSMTGELWRDGHAPS